MGVGRLTVLIGEDVGEANVARLRSEFPGVEFRVCLAPGELLAAAPDADVVFTKGLPAGLVQAASKLRWVQAGVAGIERMLANGLADCDVVLANARGAHGVPMSEMIPR